jgi:hypothetical protein
MNPAEAVFTDRLQVTLTLSIAEYTQIINAGAITEVELNAQTYGFSASVTFVISCELEDDPLIEPFNSSQAIWVTLALANGRLAVGGEVPKTQTWMGWATERCFRETAGTEIEGAPVVQRAYTIAFADPARALWPSHRPLSLHAGESIRSVLEANCVDKMQLSFDWPELDTPVDLFCIGLGAANSASFYDFVAWLLAERNGVMELDPATATYRIAHAKSTGEALAVQRACVGAVHVQVPPWWRHTTVVVNPFSEASAPREPVDNALAARGVRQDVVAYTQIPKKTEARVREEQERLRQPCHRARLVLCALPDALPAPASTITLADEFSENEYLTGQPLRLRGVTLSARNPQDPPPPDKADAVHVPFECRAVWEAETQRDPSPHLPGFTPPRYPVMVEGKVLSGSGLPADHTWHASAHSDDSQFDYRVKVPLWNKVIRVPFTAAGQPGHFFFPAAKDQRVLLALELDSARIVCFLDWMARLDNDSQGNQIAMGKRPESRTVLRHRYTNESPEFTLARTQWGDMQTLELSEGRFFLEVKEDEQVSQPTVTYDLSPQADAAKDAARSESNQTVGAVSAAFGEHFGKSKEALGSAQGELQESVKGAQVELNGKIAATRAQLDGKSSELDAVADDMNAPFTRANASLGDIEAAGLFEQSRADLSALKQDAGKSVSSLRSDLDSLRAKLAASSLAPTSSKSSLDSELARIEGAANQIEAMVISPAHDMLNRLEQTETSLKSGIARTRETLQALQEETVGKMQQLLSSAKGAVETATSTLQSVQSGITQLLGGVMAPLEACTSALEQLQTLFKTGMSTLQSALGAVLSAVDAVPVSSLPKVLVEPTKNALEKALQAGVKAIAQAGQAASVQLSTLAGTITGQIRTTSATAQAQLETAVSGLSAQIAAVLPTVESAVSQGRTAIARVIQQVQGQVEQGLQTTSSTIKATESQLDTAASQLVASLQPKLDSITVAARRSVEAARTKVGIA